MRFVGHRIRRGSFCPLQPLCRLLDLPPHTLLSACEFAAAKLLTFWPHKRQVSNHKYLVLKVQTSSHTRSSECLFSLLFASSIYCKEAEGFMMALLSSTVRSVRASSYGCVGASLGRLSGPFVAAVLSACARTRQIHAHHVIRLGPASPCPESLCLAYLCTG